MNDTPNALIIGENGAGKSTILDALTFALFGRPFRRINKPGLVNSVNKKNCLVEIEFETSGKQYKVVRGIKPNIFEIWCDGLCLNQDSATKDYQAHLEKFILKMNYKSFTQIVILGSASFTPFMQLTPAERRLVIEDLLDIQVFSVMNEIVKTRLQNNRDQLERNRIELYGKEEKKGVIERTISKLKKNSEEEHNKLTLEADDFCYKIETLKRVIFDLHKTETSLMNNIQQLSNVTSQKMYKEFLNVRGKLETRKKTHNEHMEFYCNNNDCPTCKQSISVAIKNNELRNNKSKIEELDLALTKLETKITEWESRYAKLEALLSEVATVRQSLSLKEKEIESYNLMIASIQTKMTESENATLLDNQNELVEVNKDIADLTETKQKLIEEKQFIETAVSLLKDGGIKTRIIKQYLPLINQKINKYLLQMGFMCNFNLDENFEETIKSRFRDDFSYQNFSEGEKFRIDLAILLAWRAVARMRNSVNTNILIFDEIFDGSLDGNGTDEFLKIMWSLVGDTNVFVISHKQDQLIEKFKKVYKFARKRNFSVLVE